MPESTESTAVPTESEAEVIASVEAEAVEAEAVEAEAAIDAEAPDATVEAEAPARVFDPDAVLLESVDLARRALLEVTAPETVGSVVGHLAVPTMAAYVVSKWGVRSLAHHLQLENRDLHDVGISHAAQRAQCE